MSAMRTAWMVAIVASLGGGCANDCDIAGTYLGNGTFGDGGVVVTFAPDGGLVATYGALPSKSSDWNLTDNTVTFPCVTSTYFQAFKMTLRTDTTCKALLLENSGDIGFCANGKVLVRK